jgi:glycyl-tRNA synthetase beta chain
VDDFFDKVKVNDDNTMVRGNRLKLLSRIRSGLDGVADFSKIEG